MKFSAFAVITAAMAGVGAVPVESGPLAHLENRAADVIGGVVSLIRREEVGTPVVPHQLKRGSPVRFHNARDVEYIQERKYGDGGGDVPPLSPFSTRKGGWDLEAREREEGEEAPPLASFSTSEEKRGGVPDLTRRNDPQESVPPLAPFSARNVENDE